MKNTISKANIYENLFVKSIGKLKENIKTIDEMIKILMGKYYLEAYENRDFAIKVLENTNEKYGEENSLNLENIETYKLKFKNNFYFVGFNRNNNGIYVEGNEWLKKQLILLRGLNRDELSNIFLVGEYLYFKEEVYGYS
ncbi:hypothetical protein [Miniphocaeibacter halophilus]|uniref:Uncharacterized protein n=1 Tax=Miniphocaeibacter halophilus TaxID=2931922 RepID=A0AC61MZ22_9FIRM|nr:hypothetical protein [Miniphocaeibacter halophilus]QQK08790.1 hypothetical protein JFY71_04460 [Miniphocaeibacter halophilus]